MNAFARWRAVRRTRVRFATHVPDCPQRPAFVPLGAVGVKASSDGSGGRPWLFVYHPAVPCTLCGTGLRLVAARTRVLATFPNVGIRTRRHHYYYCPACRDYRLPGPPVERERGPSYSRPLWTYEPLQCPHPWKLAFEQRTVAERYFRPLLDADPRLEVYQCRCWKFHAGHSGLWDGDDPIDLTPPTDLSSSQLGAIARITPPKEKP